MIINRFLMAQKLLCLLIGALFILSCSKQAEPEEIIRPVNTLLIKSPSSEEVRVFPGVTLASDETTLAFQIPGQIIRLPILEGDKVKKDQVVAELDAIIFQEKFNETKAILERDKNNFKRATELVKQGHLSQVDFEKVKANYETAKANYNTAANDLKNSKIRIPYDGVIVKKYVKNFEYITAKQPILLLQNSDNIDVEIHVPENVIVQLKKYQTNKEKITASFDASPKHMFAVKLKEYSSLADPHTQTFRVVFTLPKPTIINVLPGMTVSVHTQLSQGQLEENFLIPSSAVFMDKNNQPTVWVVDQKTMRVKSQKVSVANFTTDQIRILSGINPGDLIVISGANFLVENQHVKKLK